MIGLPFPNAQSAEWRAKLKHVETIAYDCNSSSSPRAEGGGVAAGMTEAQKLAGAKSAARAFYENACMRAVNQSIGRAIRHREDFAAIVLIDRRYTSKRIRDKLPGWIQAGLADGAAAGEARFGDFMKASCAFFRAKTM